MPFTKYKNGLMYNSQTKIPFPKNGINKPAGRGSMILLLSPNRAKTVEFVNDPVFDFTSSLTTRLVTDGVFITKIGTKPIHSIERSVADKYFMNIKDLRLNYVTITGKANLVKKGYNVVYEYGRWMEIIFANISKLSVKKKCTEFLKIFKNIINPADFDSYDKLLVFDLTSWESSIKSCILFNPELLNNPLSILFYIGYKYPELITELPNYRLMILNRAAKQVFLINLHDINKKEILKFKSKLSKFKSLVISASETDDASNEDIDSEVNAEVINSTKEDIKNKLKYQLLTEENNSSSDDVFKDIDIGDITNRLTSTAFDELENYEDEDSETQNEEDNEEETTIDNKENTINDLDEVISNNIDEEFEDINTTDDLDDIDTDEISTAIAEKIKDTTYKAAFMPERSEKELARIERMTKDQNKIIQNLNLDDVKRKSISTSIVGGYIDTTNPNLHSSKFVNFDKDYTEKQLEKNIDDSVAILSDASNKIFITDKEIIDSSTPMDLKETRVYKLEDENGHKMTIKFDIPKVIDGSYIYINGTKKNIRHQFILKPIVKTSPDTVQIVTAYNKVFIRRTGIVNQNMNRITVYLQKNTKFKASPGNNSMQNTDYEVPLDYIMIAKYYTKFTIHNTTFYTSINMLLKRYKALTGKDLSFNKNKEIPVGINKDKSVVMLDLNDSYTDILLSHFTSDELEEIKKINRKPRLVMVTAKILKRELPLILFMLFCEGFAAVMKKCNIQYEFVDKKALKLYDNMEWDSIKLEDGYIVWKKKPFKNELLMNGLKKSDLSLFTYDELESKETYISLILPYYPGTSQVYYALDNYKDFLLDRKAKEILNDLGYPSELIPLLDVAANMLSDNDYLIENNLNNLRIRSTEIIADIVYKTITRHYTAYRKTLSKKNPDKISIKQSEIIDQLLSADVNLIEECSILNPVLEIEKQRSVTFRGMGGIQLDRAMTLPRRAYDKSMLGTVGISTSPDANVGVNRQLTWEPQVTSTYGYIDTSKVDKLDELNAENLFTPAELLQPLQAQHDDPDRTSMAYKQTKVIIPIEKSDPVLIGNKIEAALPYVLSDEFVVTAKHDGKVVSIENGYCVIQYKNGEYYSIDINERMRKNGAGGFWIDNTLTCDLTVGQTFKEGDVLAYNKYFFTKNDTDRGASFKLGALSKIAINSSWDVYEDSTPISKRLSEKLSSNMIDEKHVNLSKFTYVDKMVKVGDRVKAGDVLIRFSDAQTSEIFDYIKANSKDNQRDIILESAKTTITSKYTGEIADIKIYTTVDIDQLDPSLAKIVKDYWNKIDKRNKTLSKYSNKGDIGYYKSGQIISEVSEVASTSKSGKLGGYYVGEEEVLIIFYIKYSVAASKGDKIVCSVAKGVVSHVFEEGMEPYSEYRPDEVIDTIIAPLAVTARKVPAIFLTIFGNKVLIELKNKIKDIYLE